MRNNGKILLISSLIFCGGYTYADYLSSKLVGGGDDSLPASSSSMPGATTRFKDGNISDNERMSVVLLSFEKEMEAAREAKAKEMEAKREARAKAEAGLAPKPIVASSQKSFPSLEEQMAAFHKGKKVAIDPNSLEAKKTVKKRAYYGTLCKGSKCYLLGINKLYKEGETVENRKIMEITANFVRFEDGEKEWFTR